MEIYLSLVLILTKILLPACSLTILKDILTPKRSTSYSTLNSVNVVGTHLIGTSNPSTYSSTYYALELYFLENTTHPEQYFTMNTTIAVSYHLVRTHQSNTYHSVTGGGFKPTGIFLLLENNATVNIGVNQLIDPITIYDTAYNQCISTNGNSLGTAYAQSVEDGRFLAESNEIILIIKTSLGYVLKYISFLLSSSNKIATLVTTDTLIPLTLINTTANQSYNQKIELSPISNKILIAFSCAIVAYSADYLLQYHGYTYLVWNAASVGWVDMDLTVDENNGDLIAYSFLGFVEVYNISTWQALGSWKHIYEGVSSGYEAVSLSLPYLYLLTYPTASTLIQIDLEASINSANNTIIAATDLPNVVSNSDISIVNGKLMIYHRNFSDVGYGYDQIFLVEVFPYFQCLNGSTCLKYYALVADNSSSSGWACVRGPTAFVSTPPVLRPTYPFPPTIVIPDNATATQPNSLSVSDPLGLFLYGLAKALPFTTMKIIPQFLSSLTILLDDLWYYRFHDTVYPQKAQYFMQKVNIVNEIRFSMVQSSNNNEPQGAAYFYTMFLGFLVRGESPCQQLIDRLPTDEDKMYMSHMPKDRKGSKLDSAYFMNSASDIYTNQVLISCVYYLILKTVQLILFLTSRKCLLLRSVYLGMSNQTKLWTLVVAILDTNVMRLSFCSFLQARLTIFFNFANKLNYTAMLVALWVVIAYALCLYGIVCSTQKRGKRRDQKQRLTTMAFSLQKIQNKNKGLSLNQSNCSQILLTRSKNVRKTHFFVPFLYESFIILVRNYFRASVHAYLLEYYTFQIGLLASIDVSCIVLVILFKKWHTNPAVFSLYLTYYTLFLIFDTFFLIKKYAPQGTISLLFAQYFSFVILILLVCISLLIVITAFFIWALKAVRFLRAFFCKIAIKPEQKDQNQQNLVNKKNKKAIVKIFNSLVKEQNQSKLHQKVNQSTCRLKIIKSHRKTAKVSQN